MLINKRLFSLVSDSSKAIVMKIVLQLVLLALSVAQVFVIASFLNALVTGIQTGDVPAAEALPLTLALLGGILILKYGVRIFQGRISARISSAVRVKLRDRMLVKLLDLETSYSKASGTASAMINNVEGIESLQVYFDRYLPQLFYSLLAPVALFVVCAPVYLPSALVFLILVPLIPVSIIMLMKKTRGRVRKFHLSYEGLGNYFLESLKGLPTLMLYKRDEESSEKLKKISWDFRTATMKLLGTQLFSIVIMDTIAFGGAAAGMFLVLRAYSAGTVSLQAALIIILLSIEFFLPMRLLGSLFHAGMTGVAAAEKIFDLLDAPVQTRGEVTAAASCETKAVPEKDLAFENVSFSYSEDKPLLREISFNLTPGEILFLRGPSGSGKSTISKLCTGFLNPDTGKISLEGTPFSEIEPEELRRKVALVSDISSLFQGTIRENLLMAAASDAKISDKKMFEALAMARLDLFVEDQPHGLDTNIGEGGNRLSGGQKQRLVLARAFLQNTKYILLDEASSNVDRENEILLGHAVSSMAETRGILIICHESAWIEQLPGRHMILGEGRVEPHKENKENKEPLYAQ